MMWLTGPHKTPRRTSVAVLLALIALLYTLFRVYRQGRRGHGPPRSQSSRSGSRVSIITPRSHRPHSERYIDGNGSWSHPEHRRDGERHECAALASSEPPNPSAWGGSGEGGEVLAQAAAPILERPHRRPGRKTVDIRDEWSSAGSAHPYPTDSDGSTGFARWLYRSFFGERRDAGVGKPSSALGSSAGRRGSGNLASSRTRGEHRGGSKPGAGPPRRLQSPDPSLPSLILLLGIPGSGKSTWAERYAAHVDTSYTIVSSDRIRLRIAGTLENQTMNKEVWEEVFHVTRELLKNRRNVIVDATNVNTIHRRSLVKHLPPCNRFIKTFSIKPVLAKMRIAKDLENGKVRAAVPDAALEKMYASFVESLYSIQSENWIVKP